MNCRICGRAVDDGQLYCDACDAEDAARRLALKSTAVPLAIIFYDHAAAENHEMSVAFTKSGVRILSILNDFELAVLSVEASIMIRKAFELPPSPVNPEVK